MPPVYSLAARQATRHADQQAKNQRKKGKNSTPCLLSFSFPHISPFRSLSLSSNTQPIPPPPKAFVSYERATGRPRGFGFVVFADPEVAARVVAQAHTIDRREVEAKRAVPKEESSPPLVPPGPARAAGTGMAPAAAAAAALMLGSSPQRQQQLWHPQQQLERAAGGCSTPPPRAVLLSSSSPPPPPPPLPASSRALAASLPSTLDLAAEGGGGGEGPFEPLPPPPQPGRKLFVGGLPPSCDDASLRAYFEQFGPVDEAVVMVDHESKRSRG